mmetsp:Transcript_11322/g.43703  ORF Transcript_11322/g.43703 Transcript_11322/m.43703 type:complete len:319 (-) Transcript_11322:650-1606(-)
MAGPPPGSRTGPTTHRPPAWRWRPHTRRCRCPSARHTRARGRPARGSEARRWGQPLGQAPGRPAPGRWGLALPPCPSNRPAPARTAPSPRPWSASRRPQSPSSTPQVSYRSRASLPRRGHPLATPLCAASGQRLRPRASRHPRHLPWSRLRPPAMTRRALRWHPQSAGPTSQCSCTAGPAGTSFPRSTPSLGTRPPEPAGSSLGRGQGALPRRLFPHLARDLPQRLQRWPHEAGPGRCESVPLRRRTGRQLRHATQALTGGPAPLRPREPRLAPVRASAVSASKAGAREHERRTQLQPGAAPHRRTSLCQPHPWPPST